MSNQVDQDHINPIDAEEKVEYSFHATLSYLKGFFFDVLDLEKGVDKRATIEEISNKKSMAGANAWMLICSIIIASIGLSQDSQAVIIGAMLISPLMSPILGIGLSVAINDMETLRKSLAHFSVAIVIAIVTSTIYFFFMDFVDVTSEIQARTKPTFLDIIVAVFGGLAGIISIARKDVSTTLPGVAIATALMPPLCVTGYGLANGNLDIASRSFYLFFLNTFFVALSTYLIVRLLKFPFKKYVKIGDRKRNLRFTALFSLLLMIPSFLIFRGVLREFNIKKSIGTFKKVCLREDALYLDTYEYATLSDGSSLLHLKVYGSVINEDKIASYQACLADMGLTDVDIQILPSSDVNLNQIMAIENNLKDINTKLTEVNDEKIKQQELVTKYAANYIDSTDFLEMRDEVKALFPEIKEIGLAKAHNSNFENYSCDLPTLLISWKEMSTKARLENDEKIKEFVQRRMKLDTIKLIDY